MLLVGNLMVIVYHGAIIRREMSHSITNSSSKFFFSLTLYIHTTTGLMDQLCCCFLHIIQENERAPFREKKININAPPRGKRRVRNDGFYGSSRSYTVCQLGVIVVPPPPSLCTTETYWQVLEWKTLDTQYIIALHAEREAAISRKKRRSVLFKSEKRGKKEPYFLQEKTTLGAKKVVLLYIFLRRSS